MRVDPHRFAQIADPDSNHHVRHRWSEPAMSPPELEYLSEIAAAGGNWPRADALSWRAHMDALRAEAPI